jgi:hypothetical protein
MNMQTKDFQYPETNTYRAASIVAKSRKLEDGAFEACAAFFVGGKRVNQVFRRSFSRHEALKMARAAIEKGDK